MPSMRRAARSISHSSTGVPVRMSTSPRDVVVGEELVARDLDVGDDVLGEQGVDQPHRAVVEQLGPHVHLLEAGEAVDAGDVARDLLAAVRGAGAQSGLWLSAGCPPTAPVSRQKYGARGGRGGGLDGAAELDLADRAVVERVGVAGVGGGHGVGLGRRGRGRGRGGLGPGRRGPGEAGRQDEQGGPVEVRRGGGSHVVGGTILRNRTRPTNRGEARGRDSRRVEGPLGSPWVGRGRGRNPAGGQDTGQANALR